MLGNIVLFTDYFMHSVIDIVEESSLTVGLYATSDYAECIDWVQKTPNLLGVAVIDWRPTKKILQFYRELFRTCDHISECLERPLTVSILYRVRKSKPRINRTRTSNIFMYELHCTTVTDEILKLDLISPIISESQGLFHVNDNFHINPSRAEFDSDYFNTVVFALLDDAYTIPYDMMNRHHLLRSIQKCRNGELPRSELHAMLKNTPFKHVVM